MTENSSSLCPVFIKKRAKIKMRLKPIETFLCCIELEIGLKNKKICVD